MSSWPRSARAALLEELDAAGVSWSLILRRLAPARSPCWSWQRGSAGPGIVHSHFTAADVEALAAARKGRRTLRLADAHGVEGYSGSDCKYLC